MELINNIGNEEKQIQRVIMADNRFIDLTLEYKDQQQGWFASITYLTYTINNIRIVTSGNMLYQWRNIFQFGMSCVVEQGQEPTFQEDFLSGRAKLYILDRADTLNYSRVISGEISA